MSLAPYVFCGFWFVALLVLLFLIVFFIGTSKEGQAWIMRRSDRLKEIEANKRLGLHQGRGFEVDEKK